MEERLKMIKNLNIKYAAIISTVIIIAIWLGILRLNGVDVDNTIKAFKEIPAAIGYFGIIAFVFTEWLWRIPILQGWLVRIPNLNGTWKGTLQTNWKNPETGEQPGPIDALLVIKQSLFKISCVQMTKESKSWSRAASIDIDNDNQIKILNYVYSNSPRIVVHDRSKAHDGASSLEVITNDHRKLIGKYWTDRNTKGEMNFIFQTKKRRQEFE